MDVASVALAFFSPTGTGRRILRAIARGVGAPVIEVDLTPPDAETRELPDVSGSLVVLCAPVYGGTIPDVAARRLARLRGEGAPAVLVAIYGNRAHENTLLVLRRIAREAGLHPMAGGAFVGEHSFSTAEHPIAGGRPDASDLEHATEFGRRVAAKLAAADSPRDLALAAVPGVDAESLATRREGISPRSIPETCVLCGACARSCPTGAATVDEVVTTRVEDCLLCCACVRSCPTDARVLDDPRFLEFQAKLAAHLDKRREPEFYL